MFRLHLKQPRIRSGWRAHQYCLSKGQERSRGTLRMDFDLTAVIAHPAAEIQLMGEPVHEWSKADALYAPTNAPSLRLDGGWHDCRHWMGGRADAHALTDSNRSAYPARRCRAKCSGVQACG